jgi:hypothetical protein
MESDWRLPSLGTTNTRLVASECPIGAGYVQAACGPRLSMCVCCLGEYHCRQHRLCTGAGTAVQQESVQGGAGGGGGILAFGRTRFAKCNALIMTAQDGLEQTRRNSWLVNKPPYWSPAELQIGRGMEGWWSGVVCKHNTLCSSRVKISVVAAVSYIFQRLGQI